MSIMPQLRQMQAFRRSMLAAQASVALLPDNCFCGDADDDDSEFYLPQARAKKTARIVGAASLDRLDEIARRQELRLAEYGLTVADMASENPSPEIRQRIAQLNSDYRPLVEGEDYRPVNRVSVYVPRVYSESMSVRRENAE